MAVIKPIPKSLLPHTVTYHKAPDKDRWGVESLGEGTELCCVRMEPTKRIVRDKNNAEVQLSAVMFYDMKNSLPKGMTFSVDDVIVLNGLKHRIQVIEPLYDNKRLHHYELGLVAHA